MIFTISCTAVSWLLSWGRLTHSGSQKFKMKHHSVQYLPEPRVRASVTSLWAHIEASLTVSCTRSMASWLLNLSQRPSLASTRKVSPVLSSNSETSGEAVSPQSFKSASPIDLKSHNIFSIVVCSAQSRAVRTIAMQALGLIDCDCFNIQFGLKHFVLPLSAGARKDTMQESTRLNCQYQGFARLAFQAM